MGKLWWEVKIDPAELGDATRRQRVYIIAIHKRVRRNDLTTHEKLEKALVKQLHLLKSKHRPEPTLICTIVFSCKFDSKLQPNAKDTLAVPEGSCCGEARHPKALQRGTPGGVVIGTAPHSCLVDLLSAQKCCLGHERKRPAGPTSIGV